MQSNTWRRPWVLTAFSAHLCLQPRSQVVVSSAGEDPNPQSELYAVYNLHSEGLKSVWCLRHCIGSWSRFKICIARAPAEKLARSLNLDHEFGVYHSFTYQPEDI